MVDTNSALIIIAAIVSFLPGAYFAYMILKGIVLALRGGKDDDL